LKKNCKIHEATKKIALLVLMMAVLFLETMAQPDSVLDSVLDSPLEELLSIDSTLTTPIVSLEDSSKIEETLTTDTLNDLKGGENSITLTGFNYSEIELKTGEIISNVLKVYNNTQDTLFFKIDLIYPGSWNFLTKSEENYKLSPNDTAFIPIVLIPNKLINGNTEITINAFIISTKNQQIGNDHFVLKTRKITSWAVNVEPSNKFYFKNGETTKEFKYSILNTGNFKQDIFISYRNKKSDLTLLNTSQKEINEPNFTASIESWEDTTLTYFASVKNGKDRNFKKISTYNYSPNKNLDYKKYTLYINSSDPKGIEKGSFKKGNKVDFIKLPNEAKLQDYGYPNLPLTVDVNIQNILANNTFMGINMRGLKQLNKNASVSYFTQINYTQDYYSTNFIKNSPWYIGYFDAKKSIEVGNISGNIGGLNAFGKGIKGSYTFSEKHKSGVFAIKGPNLFGPTQSVSYGAFHTFKPNPIFNVTAKLGRQENTLNSKTINIISLDPNFRFKQHSFAIKSSFASNETTLQDTTNTVSGYIVGVNYSSQFLKNKLRVNLGGRYFDRGFSNGTFERYNLNNRTFYRFNKRWSTFLSNSYQNNKMFNSLTNGLLFKQEFFSNTLMFQTQSKKNSYQPGLFYDYSTNQFTRIHNRGLSFRYSTHTFLRNFITSAYLRAGYAIPIDDELNKNYFNLQFTSLLRYKVWNFTARYNYGTLSFASLQTQKYQGITPQNIRLALLNQHQFKNKHFILESSLSYNYENVYNNHTLNLNPQIYFFTNNGWRFGLNGALYFNTNKSGNIYTEDQLLGFGNDSERKFNKNFRVGATIKKDFGIPIPLIKKTHASIDFLCFYDLNGDGKKDKDEPAIENVIVRLGVKEVISDNKGEAAIQNIPYESYTFSASSLERLNGWFPNVDDSLQIIASNTTFIPFVRGVKVYGDVVLDRQKIAIADTTKLFDLSRIRITAVNGKTFNTLTDLNGRFEFYMPNGKYVITMDENILGDRYTISRNNIPMTLTNKQDGVYISFYIIEKRKKVIVKEFGND
jgi:hypothetical protein